MKVWVAFCMSGCWPFVFSTKEKAEAFKKHLENKHFEIDEFEVDIEKIRIETK